MRAAIARRARRRRRLLIVCSALVALVTLVLLVRLPDGESGQAAGQAPLAEDHFFTDASMPANDVMMFGTSPREAPGETWGIGKAGQGTPDYVIVRYTQGGGWVREPAPLDSSGQPLAAFAPANGVLAGQMAPDGSGVLAGFLGKTEVLLVRSPGQHFQEIPSPKGQEGAAVLNEGEDLFDGSAPLVTALEEGSLAGALVVPFEVGEVAHPEPAVLHWEAQQQRWTREPVKLPESDSSGEFEPLAIAASSPSNAWLLARVTAGSEGVSLFRRRPGGEGAPASWEAVSPGEGDAAGAQLEIAGEAVGDESPSSGQPLTVTEQGAWVDGRLQGTKSVTLYFKAPGAAGEAGKVQASWCNAEAAEHRLCNGSLPEELPAGEYRSFAWPSSSSEAPAGERVITGFSDGTIMRLQGEEFIQVPTIGDPGSPDDVGGSKGAAFSSNLEGWLGNEELPVHASTEAPKDELEYWPAPFHKPLLAIAPEPEAPVGAISSEALAVGDGGEVARYSQAEGWQPESLFEVSGRRAETQLHAVAWPTPNRAYAVGARGEAFGVVGEMWLWRKETGLWEPDPAAPVNLRANLLDIAFAAGEASRGYVVGQEGTLLRYGKTWTQEPTCQSGASGQCLPPEVSGASFTSVAFAGSEALVAYRIPHLSSGSISYTGGVLANSGSGWHIDSEAAAALPAGYVPWAVSGLPDGGAALSASVPGGLQEPLVLERNEPGAAWQAPPQPYPGYQAPASLALFREGGALRVVGSGAIPNTVQADSVTPPPAGFPPALPEPYPLPLAAGVIRQTSTGWSDEEHERRILRAPPGGYTHWDIPYNPDPTAAILLNESGTSGWAVGGYEAAREGSQTADIARYPADGSKPPGVSTYDLKLAPKVATFAVGGGAQCAAPCAELANAKIGPDVWLQSALRRAKETEGEALRGFLYTGPRVTTGEAVHATLPIPYANELNRYREVLAGAGGPPLLTTNGLRADPAVAVSYTEREKDGSECTFDKMLFSALPELSSEFEKSCESAQSAYYSFISPGEPQVRVIVLDDSTEVESGQLTWLQGELVAAAERREPALVVGSADLAQQDQEHDKPQAEAVTAALIEHKASAYLFDAPEQNIKTHLAQESGPNVPAFGSGTLGYVNAASSEQSNFLGASGFLLVEVGPYDGATGVSQVNARLVPDIEELSFDAHKGTLLRRSEAALFSALARRPRAGGVGSGSSDENESDSFIPLTECVGSCPEQIKPEYRFSSSKPKVGAFVKPNLDLGPEEVALGANEKPIEAEDEGNYPLFCAFNHGETELTVEAGGLKDTLKVDVEEGSVRRPCGTVPAEATPLAHTERTVATPGGPETTGPVSSTPPPLVPVPPAPAAVVPPAPARPATPLPPALIVPLAPGVLPAVIVPPPLPPAAEPTPPSGTSAVTQPVAQKEEEEEEAPESVRAQASAYRESEHEPSPAYLLGIIVLAAFAGASIRRRSRRGERDVRIAPATVSTMRSQRRMTRRSGRPW